VRADVDRDVAGADEAAQRIDRVLADRLFRTAEPYVLAAGRIPSRLKMSFGFTVPLPWSRAPRGRSDGLERRVGFPR